jgi:MFS family permease
MVRAVWQPFVLSLGASMPLLGLLESIGGFGGIVSTIMLPLGGWFSDRLGRKAFVVLSSTFYLPALAMFIVAGWSRQWRWLLPGVVLTGLASVARPAVDSMTAESVAADARGRAFGLTNTFLALSGVFAPTIGGFLAQRYSFVAVMLLGAVLECGTLGLVALVLRETLPKEARPARVTSEFWAMLKRTLTPPAGLRSFYVAMTVDAFAFGMGTLILFGLLTKEYHFTPFQLGLMSSASSATWAISQLFFGHQVDKWGCIPFLILSEAISAVVILGWLLAKSFAVFLALHALWGFALATWMPAFLAWLANSVSDRQRAEEMGRLGAFKGLLSFPAPYVGGLLYEAFGFRGPILANLIGALVVILILWLFVHEPVQP